MANRIIRTGAHHQIAAQSFLGDAVVTEAHGIHRACISVFINWRSTFFEKMQRNYFPQVTFYLGDGIQDYNKKESGRGNVFDYVMLQKAAPPVMAWSGNVLLRYLLN